MATPLVVSEVSKSFTMHLRDGLRLPVVANVSFSVASGECVVLGGPSGIGKSSILKMLYGNYAVDAGQILIEHKDRIIDIASADPRSVLEVRRATLGYVSQFLRTVPRVATIDVVAEPLVARGVAAEQARERAAELLEKLNLPRDLWQLPPATFSGGEQQRVNIARAAGWNPSLLLLDEPTASLDRASAGIALGLLSELRDQGTTILGIFHDPELLSRIADRTILVTGETT